MRVGNIWNEYGGLHVKREDDGKCYWSIENYDGCKWEEIPAPLYVALTNYEAFRDKSRD